MSDPITILDYWLGEVGEDGWYAGGAKLDADVRERFEPAWHAAMGGGLGHWIDGAGPTLAFVLLTDQFPRNMFRDTAQAFASDGLALGAARMAIEAGWDLQAPEPERQFFYLPFMHAENAEDQARGVALIGERMADSGASNLLHARAHQEVIRRFGRFPTRNAALGRQCTAEEQAFLDAGGYGAVVEALKARAMR